MAAKKMEPKGSNGPKGVEGPDGLTFAEHLASELASELDRFPWENVRYRSGRYEVNREGSNASRNQGQGHIPLVREEFDRMLKLAGVKPEELKTTEGILKAKRKVLDTLEAPKGPFQNGSEVPVLKGEKVKNQIEELKVDLKPDSKGGGFISRLADSLFSGFAFMTFFRFLKGGKK